MNFTDPLGSIVFRAASLAMKARIPAALRFVRAYDSRIAPPPPYRAVKAATILRLLDERRPKLIVELGSGLSTAWFAAYADKHAARVVSFEKEQDYLARAQEIAARFGHVECVQSDVQESEGGLRYSISVPAEADFVFVDGPSTVKDRPGMDVPLLLRSGARPATIVVDGRIATVDAIKEVARDYRLQPEFSYAFDKRDWLAVASLNGQSVFRYSLVTIGTDIG